MNKKNAQGGQSTTSNEPWAGLQPYLTGSDTVTGRFDRTPLNYNAMQWAQNVAEGGTPGTAPPLFMNDQRLTGQNVQIPSQGTILPSRGGAPDFGYSPYGAQPPSFAPDPNRFAPTQTGSAVGDILNAPANAPAMPNYGGYSPYGDQGFNPMYVQNAEGAPMDYTDFAAAQGYQLTPDDNRFAPEIYRVPEPPTPKFTLKKRDEHAGGRR